MAAKYAGTLNVKKTSQREAVPGKAQVKNSAGGFGFAVSPLAMLERFLILGSDKNTYYASAKKLTKMNADNVVKLVQGAGGIQAVDKIVEISTQGRAPKNDAAVFALAVAASFGDPTVRMYALSRLNEVCRIGTHLFQFVSYVDEMRGWGRQLKSAVGNWYLSKNEQQLAYQLLKYQQRDGWSHRDVLRLAKPKGFGVNQSGTLAAILGTDFRAADQLILPRLVYAAEAAKNASKEQIVGYITDAGLTREMIPTKFLSDPEVWEALLQKMPLTALIRNLGNMSKVGLLTPLSAASRLVVEKLSDATYLRKSRLHPFNIFKAQRQYGLGHGLRGNGTWKPVAPVLDALEEAFYASFGMLPPTNKGIYVALDVSGSMGVSFERGITAREVSAVMAMAVLRSEPNYYIAGFSNNLTPLNITAKDKLDAVVRKISDLDFGGTDCALPMIDAKQKKLDVDAFVVYTDSETWAGNIHPFQALKAYRAFSGKDSKSIVCGITATGFTIADPSDPGMLDVVGMDSSVPQLIQGFIGGDTGGTADEEGED